MQAEDVLYTLSTWRHAQERQVHRNQQRNNNDAHEASRRRRQNQTKHKMTLGDITVQTMPGFLRDVLGATDYAKACMFKDCGIIVHRSDWIEQIDKTSGTRTNQYNCPGCGRRHAPGKKMGQHKYESDKPLVISRPTGTHGKRTIQIAVDSVAR